MKKLWLMACVALMACGLVAFCGCGDSDSDDSDNGSAYTGGNAVGSWALTADPSFVVTFNEGGTYASTYQGAAYDTGTWSINGNLLQTTKSTGGTFLFQYSVAGNSLSLAAIGTQADTYTRVL